MTLDLPAPLPEREASPFIPPKFLSNWTSRKTPLGAHFARRIFLNQTVDVQPRMNVRKNHETVRLQFFFSVASRLCDKKFLYYAGMRKSHVNFNTVFRVFLRSREKPPEKLASTIWTFCSSSHWLDHYVPIQLSRDPKKGHWGYIVIR